MGKNHPPNLVLIFGFLGLPMSLINDILGEKISKAKSFHSNFKEKIVKTFILSSTGIYYAYQKLSLIWNIICIISPKCVLNPFQSKLISLLIPGL